MGTPAQAGGGDPAAIRANIRETRGRMSHTIEEIGERLNPQHLKQQLTHGIHEATIGRVENMARTTANRMDETRRSLIETMSENPIPAAMVGVGLGWLILNRNKGNSTGSQLRSRSSATRRYTAGSGDYDAAYIGAGYGATDHGATGSSASWSGDAYGDVGAGTSASDPLYSDYSGTSGGENTGTMERMRERAGELGETVTSKAGAVVGRVEETAGTVATQVSDQAQRLVGAVADQTRAGSSKLQTEFRDNPLLVGAATVALGFAAGLAVPTTRKETELMGDVHDRLAERAREATVQAKDKVQQAADKVLDSAQGSGQQGKQEGNKPRPPGAGQQQQASQGSPGR